MIDASVVGPRLAGETQLPAEAQIVKPLRGRTRRIQQQTTERGRMTALESERELAGVTGDPPFPVGDALQSLKVEDGCGPPRRRTGQGRPDRASRASSRT